MSHSPVVRLLSLASVAMICAAACGGEEAPQSFLDPTDTQRSGDTEIQFSEVDSLISDTDFADPAAVRDVAQVQRFFERTPYGRRSFLSTYSSNGVSAAAAVLSAALKYRVNPIVLLARLQMAQGLIGIDKYPEPSVRTEYVFQCGCDGSDNCLPEMAGLDRQLECLAGRLRSYVAQIESTEEGVTDGGWGPNIEATTVDGVNVLPPDKATAAIYQYDPYYGEQDKIGAWLFYRMYTRYSRAFQYSGTIDPQASGSWIGDACVGDGDCSQQIQNGYCLAAPGGYCTARCATDGCPNNPQKPPAYCADLGADGGGCVVSCNPASNTCREGYACVKVTLFGSTDQVDACTTVP